MAPKEGAGCPSYTNSGGYSSKLNGMSSRLQLVLQQSRSRGRIGHYTLSRITKIGILLRFLLLRLITIKLLRYRLDLIALIIAVANSLHSHGRRKRGRSEILIISIAPYPGLWPWPVILVLENLYLLIGTELKKVLLKF